MLAVMATCRGHRHHYATQGQQTPCHRRVASPERTPAAVGADLTPTGRSSAILAMPCKPVNAATNCRSESRLEP
jgi:hypothetical protein